jgi:hypothetical protein
MKPVGGMTAHSFYSMKLHMLNFPTAGSVTEDMAQMELLIIFSDGYKTCWAIADAEDIVNNRKVATSLLWKMKQRSDTSGTGHAGSGLLLF